MSEWSYSEEELDEYFSDPSVREEAVSEEGAPDDGRGGAERERPRRGIRGFFHSRISDPRKAQAAVALSVITGVLLVGTITLGVYIWSLTDDVPSTERLENPSMQLATIAYTADGEELARYATQNRSWAPYDSISQHVVHALVATEDHRFYQHWGVDPQAIVAATADILTGGFRGASTVTQQLARNLYNEEVGRAVSIERKLKEMVTAVELERRYTKREILEMYLNTVSFGYNAYGIEAAARTYFGVPAKELNELQAATLVGMLRATSHYNPLTNPNNAKQRRNVVLRLMERHGYLDASFYQNHKDEPVKAEYQSAELYNSLAPYFAEHVRNVLTDWSRDPDHPLSEYDVYGDGLRVYTTIDSKLQKMARSAVKEQASALQKVVDYEWNRKDSTVYSTALDDYRELEPGKDYKSFEHFWEQNPEVLEDALRTTARYDTLRKQGLDEAAALTQLRSDSSLVDSLKTLKTRLSAGLVALDPRNSHVKVWIGGRNFRTEKYDKVGIARRQPGSTFKPFTYTAAIDNGYSPYEKLKDSTFTFKLTDVNTAEVDSVWTPQNYDGTSSGQMLTLSQGLANSVNTVTARLALDINPMTVAQYARQMGIRESPLSAVPSIALGTSNVTLLEMATAYSTLANGGLYNEPVSITRIEDRYGNVIWEGSPSPSEALSERTAYTVVDMMRGVIDYGTGQRIRTQFELGGYDLAGKTGTTQRSADTWFMLMHPELVSGAWMGFDDQRVTFRTSWWGQGAHSALFLVGDFYSRVAQSDSVSLLSRNAAFPMVENYGPPEDTTGTQDGGLGW
ncbi:MAG: penicillin-binding protein [Bacteroidetes bacterium QH_7_62_13]|nr:MAG: penicillin-binding protein [Bacteroidetes bacterium QH_7_62_13]